VDKDLRSFPGVAPSGAPITIDFEGSPLPAFAGEPVAASLFAAGIRTLGRSTKYHRPRGLFCLDGHCASCTMRVDGRPNRRSCMVPARAGLACERQNAFPSADVDLLAAADWLFPRGMDHHTLMTGSRTGNAMFLKMVREMGGSGTLPDAAARATATTDQVLDACVIGGGPAGLAAAREIARAAPGARVALFDEQTAPGGSLHAEPDGARRARALADEVRAAGATLVPNATAIGFFPEDVGPDGSPGVLAVAADAGLVRISARRTLYATGAYDQNLPFADNDRPGVIAARALGRLAFRWGIRPVPRDGRVVILDAAPAGAALDGALAAAGVEVERIDATHDTVVAALGGKRLRGVALASPRGKTRTAVADLVAVAAVPAPASELPRQHGARVAFDGARGGFATVVDARHATDVPGVFACGDVTGFAGSAAAERAGAAAGRALAATLALLLALVPALFGTGCAAPAAPPPATADTPDAAVPGPPRPVQPPPFAAGTPATPESRADARTTMRKAILDAAWRTVRDKHYDKTLHGVDWNAMRAKYEPLALAAPSDAAFYRVANQMIGELGQSHMLIVGPGAEEEDGVEQMASPGEMPAPGPPAAAGTTPPGAAAPAPRSPPSGAPATVDKDGVSDPGLTIRVIDGRPTITRVRAGSGADQAGLAPGYVVTQIAGRPLAAPHSARPLRPVEERFAIRRAAQRRLQGPPGTRVSIAYLDDRDRPGNAVLVRDPPRTAPVRLGHLPPLYPEVRAYEVGNVGVIAFNVFLLQPILEEVKRAMARFTSHHVKAVVLDLRGNPGGQGAMAIPIASLFVTQPVTLGTMHFREFSQTFKAQPEMGAVPFTGPLAILTDEGSASAAEILAAGLQEARRAIVVGDTTLGAVLPSVIEALPGGAVMQYVVADFKTPKGVALEGRGVQPDKRVVETRAALKGGRDPVLDAALVALKSERR
jgi:sarcosine oxidase, subunit alpha